MSAAKNVAPTRLAATTQYGFVFGSATVERACSDDKKGWVLMLLTTPKHPAGIQLYVTKTGKVRIYSDGKEWEAPAKE